MVREVRSQTRHTENPEGVGTQNKPSSLWFSYPHQCVDFIFLFYLLSKYSLKFRNLLFSLNIISRTSSQVFKFKCYIKLHQKQRSNQCLDFIKYFSGNGLEGGHWRWGDYPGTRTETLRVQLTAIQKSFFSLQTFPLILKGICTKYVKLEKIKEVGKIKTHPQYMNWYIFLGKYTWQNL